MKIDGILKKYLGLYLWCLWSHRKNIVAKLKRNVHPKQRSGSQSRKKLRPNFGRDLGLIKPGVLVSFSVSRRALYSSILFEKRTDPCIGAINSDNDFMDKNHEKYRVFTVLHPGFWT
jgi:hypothetical protein